MKCPEEAKSRVLWFAWGWGRGERRNWSVTVFWDDENVLKVIEVIDAQLCEYMNNHLIMLSKWVNCIQCELYINKIVTKKLTGLWLCDIICITVLLSYITRLQVKSLLPFYRFGDWALEYFARVMQFLILEKYGDKEEENGPATHCFSFLYLSQYQGRRCFLI